MGKLLSILGASLAIITPEVVNKLSQKPAVNTA